MLSEWVFISFRGIDTFAGYSGPASASRLLLVGCIKASVVSVRPCVAPLLIAGGRHMCVCLCDM